MKNSDFIQMSQCYIFSIKFPTDNIKEVLENAKIDLGKSYTQVEIVKNPMTGEKVQELENGLFFTMRTTFKKVTRELLSTKIYELKQTHKNDAKVTLPSNEIGWRNFAEMQLIHTLPYSSELVNVFYCPEKELLITNSRSKHSQLALHHLIKLFGLVGFRSVAVSDEKLGLNTRLKEYLAKGTPMFKFLNFEYEATLVNREESDETFLTCRHLSSEKGKEKALQALNNGFRVQSAKMWYEGHSPVHFKLDGNLKLRSIRFSDCADVSKQLNAPNFAGKSLAFTEYLESQFDALLKIAECTVLEFVNETKLESFV
ncbi:hypothetical protein E2R48_00715 [Histophilus somni]|uniref:Recombination-associated protein RdgC n=1 Tax=Histophilus somni TaxID=731 RepID=A0AAX2S1L2_HISSO|nr:hypothetical protein [Histophilus somni]TEW31416.1 hypothetical protein E2R48_00715 [Histophilus somni]THA97464.1 hypothetical protein E6A58_00715 [Histophilus somni]